MYRLLPLRKVSQGDNIDSPDYTRENHNEIMKKEKAKSEFFFRYGYFYYPYKQKCFYYELLYILRRYIFILFDIFIIPLLRIHNKYNPLTFIIAATILLWGFFLIHIYLKPYRTEIKIINKLETLSYIALLTSYFFASLVLVDYKEDSLELAKTEDKTSPLWLSGAMFVLTLSTNIGNKFIIYRYIKYLLSFLPLKTRVYF